MRASAFSAFAVIFGLLFVASDPRQAAAVLFVVPVAALALSDGVRGGLAGAATATVLVVAWAQLDDVGLNALGYGSRIVAFLTIGLLVGRFEELARAYERRQLGERYAAELHDRVVQSLVVARYRLDGHPEAQRRVDEALSAAKDIISRRLGEVAPGELRISEPHPAVPPPQQRDQ